MLLTAAVGMVGGLHIGGRLADPARLSVLLTSGGIGPAAIEANLRLTQSSEAVVQQSDSR